VAAFLSLVSIVPLHFVKEPAGTVKGVAESGRGKLSKSLVLFIIISAVFTLGNFGYMFFVLRAQDSLGGGLKVAAPILLYVLYNIFYAAFAVPLGAMSDRIGRERVIVIGYLLFSVTSVGFAMLHTLPAFLVLFALYGIAFAAVDGNQRAFISDMAGKGARATALGVFQTVNGSVALAAGLIAGLLWEKVNPVATFICGALFTMAGALLLLLFRRFFSRPEANLISSGRGRQGLSAMRKK
jgi:MFS family permease